MSKTALFLMICMATSIMLPSCEKAIIDEYPIMRSYYVESVNLSNVTIDSIEAFGTKVDRYITDNPLAKEHHLYPKILENIHFARLNITITVDDSWAGCDTIRF